MISAFGIDHGEISKGVPRNLSSVAVRGKGKAKLYARERMMAHFHGRHSAQNIANQAGSPADLGREARVRSRKVLET